MKQGRVPLRADHDLLTLDPRAASGPKLCPVLQRRSGGVAAASGEPPALASSSPTSRRLRFEDETEAEVDSRYLDRQRRWTSHRVARVLVCKPKLSLYVSGVRPEAGHRADGATGARAVLSAVEPSPVVTKKQVQSQYRLDLWTEPIKETHIGPVTPPDTCRREIASGNRVLFKPPPIKGLPVNPYSPSEQSRTQDHEERREKNPCFDPKRHKSSQLAGNKQSPPPSGNNNIRQPIGEDLHFPQPFSCRRQASRLSLRRIVSSIVSRGTRTGSLDRVTAQSPPRS
ncbi:uncharacterized protein LOC133543332 isoform X2 [Nerophis ophidion]|uniref:uncharacterized protein LOC133543332 isoform X2 n=1 Tax=Nerophis ophidion TaxID=159077 RepID=UPI002AE02A69|nr:uncharacterized protein LOC133543332 isoform X2 [Nerophis ophidion]